MFPENLEAIGEQAFAGTAFEMAVLPPGVWEIGAEAFMGSALKRVYLPPSVQVIDDRAFYGCEGITAYVVPDSPAALWCIDAGIDTVMLSQIPPVWMEKIALNTSAITLSVEGTYHLTAETDPSQATGGCIWRSSDISIAEVSSEGIVTAVSPGKAEIICEAEDGGGVMDVCHVSVHKKVKYRALLLGEVGYSTQLRGPDNDVSAMTAMLLGLGMGYQVTSQIDATKAEIIELISYAFGNQGPDDVSLFYYSGHGVTNSSTYYSGALMTVDVDYITTDELAEMLNAIPGKVIVILDSCGSGAAVTEKRANSGSFDPKQFNAGVINAFQSVVKWQSKSGELRQEKFCVLTGSAYEEDSQTTNSDGVWGGLLTKGIVSGNGFAFLSANYLGEGPADQDHDLVVTLAECKMYCQNWAGDIQHIQAWPDMTAEEMWYLPNDAE